MKTLIELLTLRVLALLIALLVGGAARAHAQQQLEIPAPQMQGQPPVHYGPRPTPRVIPPSNQERTIPSRATPTPPPRAATPAPPPSVFYPAQPILPAVFRGCWLGTVSHVDSIQRLPGGARIGPWAAKTYRLCYRRVGNGPFELTFSDSGVAPNSKIASSQGRMKLVSTNGRTYASMQAYLHFNEYHAGSHFSGGTFAVDEVTNLECDIKPDGMHVWGAVVGRRNGKPWFRARWQTVFAHVSR